MEVKFEVLFAFVKEGYLLRSSSASPCSLIVCGEFASADGVYFNDIVFKEEKLLLLTIWIFGYKRFVRQIRCCYPLL